MEYDDIRISIKKVLDDIIRKVYQKYKWQPTFKIIEDLPGYRILIRFRIGLTDFAMNVDAEHLDPDYLKFWGLKFEEEFLKCEEKAKARLAYDGEEIIKDRVRNIYYSEALKRIAIFDKLIIDEKKHKRFLRKKIHRENQEHFGVKKYPLEKSRGIFYFSIKAIALISDKPLQKFLDFLCLIEDFFNS